MNKFQEPKTLELHYAETMYSVLSYNIIITLVTFPPEIETFKLTGV